MPDDLNEDGNLASDPDVICTYTGRWVHPTHPHPNEISIEDIAHALAHQCRFTGHTRFFYSVAEHSVHCATMAPPELELTALLHDASEAYLSDLARPVKHTEVLGAAYREVEVGLETVIAQRFDLVYPYPDAIKRIDNAMLTKEIQDLMPPEFARRWPACDAHDRSAEGVPAAPSYLHCWKPTEARARFLARFTMVTAERGEST